MPTSTWDLALAELIYYVPTTVPVVYCFWKHRHTGILGWLFLAAFVLLQIIGSGLTLAGGEHGTPSRTAVTITSIGLSPLILAIAGVVKEWAKLGGLLKTKKRNSLAVTVEVLYHLAVVTAIAIYATGASSASQKRSEDNANTEWRVGILLLLILWIVLSVAFALLSRKVGVHPSRALFWSISISLVLVGMRIIYQCIATFNKNHGSLNPVTGSIALRVVFQFLPGAFTLLALVAGGVMSIERVEETSVVT